MADRAGHTALFGFSAMFAGAALAWSLAILASLGLSALSEHVPESLQAYGAFWGGAGLVVGLAAGGWLFAFAKWVRRLPSLRPLTAAIILAPFFLGFGLVGRGLLQSFLT